MTKVQKERKSYTYRGITFVKHKDSNKTLMQIRNLIDMAYHIQNAPPPIFDMTSYGSTEDEKFEAKVSNKSYYWEDVYDIGGAPIHMRRAGRHIDEAHSCGTSACALGTAAFHGVGSRIITDMSWPNYAEKSFGIVDDDYYSEYEFLFSGSWSRYDNTPEGAVARILALIIEGGDLISHYNYGNLNFQKEEYKKYLGIKISEEK